MQLRLKASQALGMELCLSAGALEPSQQPWGYRFPKIFLSSLLYGLILKNLPTLVMRSNYFLETWGGPQLPPPFSLISFSVISFRVRMSEVRELTLEEGRK